MSKYSVESYYTCSFKVKHFLDNLSDKEITNLEKREDGKYEILDIKLDNRKTKNLNVNKNNESKDNENFKQNIEVLNKTSSFFFFSIDRLVLNWSLYLTEFS